MARDVEELLKEILGKAKNGTKVSRGACPVMNTADAADVTGEGRRG